MFDPVPPTTTPGIGEPQERQEIGSVIRPSTVFNVGFAGGFTSNRSTIEDFTPEGGGGVFGATFGARWYGLNNAFMGVQGNVLFPVVTQSTNVTSGPTVKLQTLFTQDFQVGFKLAAPETVRPADRIFFPADFYAFIGVAEGRVQANFAPFTDTKTLIGPTFGIGFDVNVAPNVMLFGKAVTSTSMSRNSAFPVPARSRRSRNKVSC